MAVASVTASDTGEFGHSGAAAAHPTRNAIDRVAAGRYVRVPSFSHSSPNGHDSSTVPSPVWTATSYVRSFLTILRRTRNALSVVPGGAVSVHAALAPGGGPSAPGRTATTRPRPGTAWWSSASPGCHCAR